MIAISTLLAPLSRPDVAEVCLATGKRPALRFTRGGVEEMAVDPLSGDDMLRILFGTGGSRHVESLGTRPAQWRTRVEGVGMVGVSASQHDETIEARFVLRDTIRSSNTSGPMGAVTAPSGPMPAVAAPSAPPPRLAPRSVRPRTIEDGVPSSRRGKAPRAGLRERTAPPPAHDEGDRPSALPTPPRGTTVPREAMPSTLEIDLGSDIPSVPKPHTAPVPAVPPTLPPPQPSYPRHHAQASQPSRPAAQAQAIHPPQGLHPPAIQRFAAEEVIFSPMSPRTLPSVQGGGAAPAEHISEPPPPLPEIVATIEPRRASNVGRITRPFERDPQTPLFRKLLRTARELGGSDLHIVAGRAPLVRVGGQIVRISGQTGGSGEALEPELVEDMILARVPRRLEETFAREGSCDFALDEQDLGRLRVNVARHRTGIKASLRLIPLSIPGPSALGIPEAVIAAARRGRGLIVIAGPVGHGKTTTVASVVDLLNTELCRHIVTVEDPIEIVYPERRGIVSQREVGVHARSFVGALRAALRQDPDVLVAGELRDAETARVALAASESGRLVLATMSAPGAARAIDRLLDLFPPGEQAEARAALAGALRLVLGQRLVPDTEGRTLAAAVEVLPGGGPLASLIRENRTYQIPAFQQRGRDLGVLRLDESLRELTRAGRISAARALSVAESPEELELALGIRRPSQAVAQVSPQMSPHGSPHAGTPPARPVTGSQMRPEVKPPSEAGGSKGLFDFFKKGGG
jgi:twitching motility protein PilT